MTVRFVRLMGIFDVSEQLPSQFMFAASALAIALGMFSNQRHASAQETFPVSMQVPCSVAETGSLDDAYKIEDSSNGRLLAPFQTVWDQDSSDLLRRSLLEHKRRDLNQRSHAVRGSARSSCGTRFREARSACPWSICSARTEHAWPRTLGGLHRRLPNRQQHRLV